MKTLTTNKEIGEFLGINPLQSISFRVTQACNLKCKHCYAAAGKQLPNELSTQEIKNILDQAKDLGAIRVFFGGGEPFIRKDMVELLKYAKKLKYAVYISTNGTIIDKKTIIKIAKLNISVFQVSIDGINNTHDKIRGVSGTFNKAMSTLKIARKYLKNTKIALAFSLMFDNKNEVLDMLDLAVSNKVDIFALIPLFPSGRMRSKDDITVKEKAKIFKQVCRYYLDKYKKSTTKFPVLPFLSILTSPGIVPKDIKNIDYGCGFVCTFPNILGVDSQGDVYPCDGLIGCNDLLLGNIKKKKLSIIWKNKIMEDLRSIEKNNLKGVCKKCKELDSCMGGCRAYAYKKYGNFYASDPLCQSFYDAKIFPKSNIK